jgi:hypothetical protein
MQLDGPNSVTTSGQNVIPGAEAAREQVDRILASDTFHASDVLRRLLRFLAAKTFSGTADDLKEYSIGLDALGKPPTYDPRQDAAVRLQASRLRQKLEDYYRKEGANDSVVIELPKGRFKIAWRVKDTESFPPATLSSPLHIASTDVRPAAPSPDLRKWRLLAIASMLLSLVLALANASATLRGLQTAERPRPTIASDRALEALWSPFLTSGRHLIIAFVNPLFVRLQRNGGPDIVYRTSGNHSWDAVLNDPELPVLKQALGNATATPTFNLVERSNLISTFVLSQFLARRRADISLARADQISWQQFADNDVILFGPFAIDGGQSALPVKPLLAVDRTGVRNFKPQPGEPPVYVDPPSHSPTDGEALELVSVMPGPLGRTTVVTFSSNNKWGVIGGTQSLTDPAFARLLEEKLKKPSGKLPTYYQVLLQMKYRDGTLTHVSYVTHRPLTMTQTSTEASTAQ